MKNLQQGLILGKSELDIAENGYSFALNMMVNNSDVEGELTDEISNRLLEPLLDEGYYLIGTCNMLNQDIILFTTNNTGGFKVYIQYADKVSEILSTNCFNYTTQNPIKAEFRIINNCDRIVYFYDGNEPDRFILIDDIDYHKDIMGSFICNSFLLKPEYITPNLRMVGLLESSGNLLSGAYSIKARYVDKYENYTDWSCETTPYPITSSGSLHASQTLEGVDYNTSTNNGLLFKLENLDTSFKYIEVAVNRYSDKYTVESFIYNRYPITSDNLSVSITSISNLKELDYVSTNIPTAKYENSKVMLQNDNRLLRANLKEKYYDWGQFQQEANTIQVTYDREEVDTDANYIDDPIFNDGPYFQLLGPSNKSPYSYRFKSMLRDEVYALGIVWVFNDGSESPVFHIPGRKADTRANGTPIPYTNSDPNTHNRPAPLTSWDLESYATNSISDADIYDGIATSVQRWQIFNTAYFDGDSKELAYYECRDLNNNPILYPDIRGCNNLPIFPYTLVENSIIMDPIRHHKMPDTTLEAIFKDLNPNRIFTINLVFNNVYPPEEYENSIKGFRIVIGERENDKTVLDKGILTTINRVKFNQYLANTVTNNNRDIKKIFINSLQFSHDNQSPKSFSLQTSDQFNVEFSGGYQSFMFLPACSDTIAYQEENCEQVGDKPLITAKNLVGYHSPLTKLKSEELQGTHIKFEREVYTHLTLNGDLIASISNNNYYVHNNRKELKHRATQKILSTNVYQRFINSYVPYGLMTNRIIKNQNYIEADSTFNGITRVSLSGEDPEPWPLNNKTQQELLLIQLYGSKENYAVGDFHINDDDCTYPPDFKGFWAEPWNYTQAYNFFVPLGITHIHEKGGYMSYNYVAIKRLKTDCYYQLDKIKYVDTSNIINIRINNDLKLWLGDSFITRFAFKRSFYGYVPHAGNMALEGIWKENTDSEGYSEDMSKQNTNNAGAKVNAAYESQVIDLFYESDINMEWRQHGSAIFNNDIDIDQTDHQKKTDEKRVANAGVRTQMFFPKYYGQKAYELLMLEVHANSISRLKDDGEWTFYKMFPNFYKLNDHYSIPYPNYRKFAFNYDKEFCDECVTTYPTRIIWSEKSYEEDVKDTFRIYKVNNYKDITNNSGEIKDIFELNQKVYVNTMHAMYLMPVNAQQIQTNAQTVYVGNSAYMSIDPFRIGNTNYSYAGNQGRFNRITTEFGTFFINQEQCVIYQFTDKLEEISLPIQRFLYENLHFSFAELYRRTAEKDYPLLDNHTASWGLGLITGLDYSNSRLIVHKKDFYPLYPIQVMNWEPEIIIPENTLVYFENTGQWVFNNGEDTITAYFTNEELFENKSFTLSYDIQNRRWISFHSYQPLLMYYNTHLYSTPSLTKIYKHDDYQSKRFFYENQYPSIIEYISYKSYPQVKTDNIQFLLRTEKLINGVYKELKNVSFYKAIVYNSYQSSGEFELVFKTNPYQSYIFSNTQKIVDIKDNIHRITGVRDLVTDDSTPLFSNSWADISTYYGALGQGYIDKVPNTAVLDTTKSLYQSQQLKDQFQKIRLIFDNDTAFRFRIQALNNNYTQSFR